MTDYLLKLIAHDRWANARLIEHLKGQPSVPPRTMELFGHIIAAHRFWEKRITGQSIAVKDFDFFPRLSLDVCAAESNYWAQRWSDYIQALPQPLADQTVSFIAIDGNPVTFRIIDAFTQLHCHGIHHRAQISVDLRAAGLEPVLTDYLLYCRMMG